MESRKQHLSDQDMFQKIPVNGVEVYCQVSAENHAVVKCVTEIF